MSPATHALQEALIRAIKQALAAWEAWLQAHDETLTKRK
jgi:hypothetical protein